MGSRHGRLALLVILSLLISGLPTSAQADEVPWYTSALGGLEVTADVLLLRPLAAVTVASGAVLFLPAALMASPGGRAPIEEAWEIFVLVPGEELWGRPLGSADQT